MTPADPSHDGTDSKSLLSRRSFVAATGLTALGVAGLGTAVAQQSQQTRSFTIRLENVSDGSTLQTTADDDLAEQAVPLSPLAYAVHTNDEPIFTSGEHARANGLQELAEDGNPAPLAESLMERETVFDAGAVATPDGASGPGPLTPGNAYEFTTEAMSGNPRAYLSLVTMFVPSNDLFYALGGASGMALFRDGQSAPMSGPATDHVGLWDAGTEINEEPGTGPNQAQRQRGAGIGLVERNTVVHISDVLGYSYPATEDVLRLTVTPSQS